MREKDNEEMRVYTRKTRIADCLQDIYGDKLSRQRIGDVVARHCSQLMVRIHALAARAEGPKGYAFLEHYGLVDREKKSLDWIADKTHLTREQVRQDIEEVKTYFKQASVAVALFAYTETFISDEFSHKEVSSLLDYFVEYEVQSVGNPFKVDEEGCLVCKIDMAKYTKIHHSVVIPDGTRIIPVGTFALCGSELTEVQLPNTLEIIEEEAFAGTGLGTIICPPSLRTIGQSAFEGCTALCNLLLNKSLEAIGDRAFADCEGLEDVILPSTLGSIGVMAFDGAGCDDIYLPESLKTCGWAADITHVASLEHWLSMSHDDRTSDQRLFIDGKELIDVSIPEGTRVLKKRAFSGCAIESLRLPAGLRAIKEEALDFTNIEHLYLPDGFYDLYLSYMTNLKSIRVPDSIRRFDLLPLSPKLLASCNQDDDGILYFGNETNPYVVAVSARYAKTDKVVLPNGCRVIGVRCFAGTRVKEVVLPKSVSQIGNLAFAGCKHLAKVNIPQINGIGREEGIRHLGNDLFAGCDNLHTVRYDGLAQNCFFFKDHCEDGQWFGHSSIDTISCMDGDVTIGKNGVLSYHRDLPEESGQLSDEDLQVEIDSVDGSITVEWYGKIGFGQWDLYTKNGNVLIDSQNMDLKGRKFSKHILRAILDKAISDD